MAVIERLDDGTSVVIPTPLMAAIVDFEIAVAKRSADLAVGKAKVDPTGCDAVMDVRNRVFREVVLFARAYRAEAEPALVSAAQYAQLRGEVVRARNALGDALAAAPFARVLP